MGHSPYTGMHTCTCIYGLTVEHVKFPLHMILLCNTRLLGSMYCYCVRFVVQDWWQQGLRKMVACAHSCTIWDCYVQGTDARCCCYGRCEFARCGTAAYSCLRLCRHVSTRYASCVVMPRVLWLGLYMCCCAPMTAVIITHCCLCVVMCPVDCGDFCKLAKCRVMLAVCLMGLHSGDEL